MPLFRPSELRAFLDSLGIAPKKGLSQNFLIDGNIVEKILDTAEIAEGDHVLEIGPGPGVLTEAMLARGAHVVAVEKDDVLAKALKRFDPEGKQLQVFATDARTFPFEQYCPPGTKVVANLPYHLTSHIVAKLVEEHGLFASLTVMVQKEVAQRFSAEPGTKDYSSFSLFLRYHCTPSYAFKVGKQCFFPVPKVDSAVAHMVLHTPPEVSDEEAFFKLTRTAFQQKRKMLRGSLSGLVESFHVERALEELGLPPTTRPEALSLEQFLALFELLSSK